MSPCTTITQGRVTRAALLDGHGDAERTSGWMDEWKKEAPPSHLSSPHSFLSLSHDEDKEGPFSLLCLFSLFVLCLFIVVG